MLLKKLKNKCLDKVFSNKQLLETSVCFSSKVISRMSSKTMSYYGTSQDDQPDQSWTRRPADSDLDSDSDSESSSDLTPRRGGGGGVQIRVRIRIRIRM